MKILVRGAWLGSGLLAVALFAGCPAKQEQGVSTDEGGTSVSGQPAEEAPADDEAAVKALEASGATLKKNDAGRVVEVTLGQEGGNADLEHLKGLPSVRKLTAEVRGVNDEGLALLKGHPNLRVIELFQSEVTNAGMAHLKELPKLEELDLKRANITAEGYKHLAEIKTLKRIRAPQTYFDDACLDAIKGMSQLELLDLSDCNLVTTDGLKVVKNFPKLRFLRVYGPGVQDTVTEYVKDLNNLQALMLLQSGVSAEGTKNLAGLTKLKELSFYGSPTITSDALEPLAGLTNLEKLDLRSTAVANPGMVHLKGLTKLKDLDLSETAYVADEGMQSLAGLTNLEDLNLWATQISDEGLKVVSGMPKLKRLNLDKTMVTDPGLAALEGLDQLEYLHIGSTQITDEGLKHLHGLKNLKHLVVTFCPGVTDDGVKALQDAVPGLTKIER